MPHPPRTTVAAGLLALTTATLAATPTPRPLTLENSGPARQLPDRLLGASAEALIEHLITDPAKINVLKTMHLAFDRFPGGSQANFYDWRSAQIIIPANDHSSAYVQLWNQAAARIHNAMPQGVTFQQYAPFSQALGAETVFVPNLETSTIADQVAWLQQLKKDGITPRYIELGNEFWIAMGFDPDSLKRWPDEPAAMKVMKQYADAFRPFLPDGGKMAVQSAASDFWIRAKPTQPTGKRLRQWDDNLAPAPWFDAVTLHLYPRIDEIVANPAATLDWAQPERAIPLFHALLAHCDAGVDHTIDDVSRRVPGKDIWITEWNARGADHTTAEQPPPLLMALLAARMTSAFLRHPHVTMALFFTMNFNRQPYLNMFTPDGQGGYQPVPEAIALSWFNQAATGSPTWQRLIEAGARAIPTDGWRHETFLEIEADMFQTREHTTLLIQNDSPTPRTWQIPASSSPSQRGTPTIEALTADDPLSPRNITPTVQPLSGSVIILPYSLTRITW